MAGLRFNSGLKRLKLSKLSIIQYDAKQRKKFAYASASKKYEKHVGIMKSLYSWYESYFFVEYSNNRKGEFLGNNCFAW